MSEECSNYSKNLKDCTCTYEPCSRKGTCCECLQYHLKNGQAPACLFSKETEKTYDRSLEALMRDLKNRV